MIQDTDKTFCSILFDVMREKGVREVVCSPGSRNAPLLIAAAARDDMRKHVVIDERAAAFMALGMAEVSRCPVALVCTSGTALLNYAPAVAEAFYKGVSLIVVSADRPLQWIDQDDSQTLRQFEALSNFVKGSYELPSWGNGDMELQWYANRIVNDACCVATTGRPGPVHINVRLSEPLSGKTDIMPSNQRVIEMLRADGFTNKEMIRDMAHKVASSNVLFVAGFMPPDSRLHKAALQLCSLGSVAAMTETISNLHVQKLCHSIDSVLTAYPDEFLDNLAPDIVISVGGSLVSRKLKEYLRRNRGNIEHWSVGWHDTTTDCFMSLSKRIETDPAIFIRQLAAFARRGGAGSDYCSRWIAAKERALVAKERVQDKSGFTELRVFRCMCSGISPDVNLFLSNGTPIRYAQFMVGKMPHASYCNRGVSGIDGCASTAIGASKAYKGKTLLITGDMSMSYDVGSLALPDIPDTMKIMVIDNQGGGIFRFIPTTSSLPERDAYFCCHPNLPLRGLAGCYGWNYMEASDEDEFKMNFKRLLASERKAILRVIVDGEKSAEVLKRFMAEKVDMGKENN